VKSVRRSHCASRRALYSSRRSRSMAPNCGSLRTGRSQRRANRAVRRRPMPMGPRTFSRDGSSPAGRPDAPRGIAASDSIDDSATEKVTTPNLEACVRSREECSSSAKGSRAVHQTIEVRDRARSRFRHGVRADGLAPVRRRTVSRGSRCPREVVDLRRPPERTRARLRSGVARVLCRPQGDAGRVAHVRGVVSVARYRPQQSGECQLLFPAGLSTLQRSRTGGRWRCPAR
jgi:hypothetical protein